jgi:UDPglucose 6-dehydrogenase
MVAAIGSRGGTVIGVDLNPGAVEAVNGGRAPVQETALAETLAANRERIRATLDTSDAVAASAITFVIVPTPSDERGAFSAEHAARAFTEIGRALQRKRDYHLVVLTSTVLPGTTRHVLLPILERESGRTAGIDFGLCYSPEFIALGSVIRDFLNPDFTLIGELDARSGDLLESYYAGVMANGAPSRRMSLENAELAKVSVNAFVTMKITFANMLASLCERIPGGDVDVITAAIGSDARIGTKYLKGGLGFGGPCFPRDNVALAFFADAVGEQAHIPEATDVANERIPDRVADRTAELVQPGETVGVLGLAYKPCSHVIEESQAVMLIERLRERGLRVLAYDPLVGAVPSLARDADVRHATSVADLAARADVVVIATPDASFAAHDWPATLRSRPALRVLDCWRLLDTAVPPHARERYHVLGRGPAGSEAARGLATLWASSRPA